MMSPEIGAIICDAELCVSNSEAEVVWTVLNTQVPREPKDKKGKKLGNVFQLNEVVLGEDGV